MSNVKKELLEIVEQTVIPEVEDYLEDLYKLIKTNEAKEDDMDIIRDLESFLVELENIVLAINKDKMNDKEASEIYQRILNFIEESKKHTQTNHNF